MTEHLKGGRDNIIRNKDVVYRPSHEWSSYVQEYLSFLHAQGFDKVPYPMGFTEDGQEILSFVDGSVFNEELPEAVRSDETLVAFAKFIRRFHDLGEAYIKQLTGNEKWMLPIRTKMETMCHSDLAPYNTVFRDGKIAGLIDFDTLHPGSRLWDISYALYRWVPLMSEDNPENFGSHFDKERRIETFLNAYGTDVIDESDVITWVIRRLTYLIDFMKHEAAGGDETFRQHIEEGHLKGYEKNIEYISSNML